MFRYSPYMDMRPIRGIDDMPRYLSNTVPVRILPKVGRNELCPCGSGNKFKRCCGIGSNVFNKKEE